MNILEQALEALINSNSLILATDDVANVVRAGNNAAISALKEATCKKCGYVHHYSKAPNKQ